MSAAEACPITGLQRILVATDGSAFSESAMQEAVNLAKTCSSKLYAMSVIEVNPEYEALAPKAVEKSEIETKKVLDRAKEFAEQDGVQCETIVHRGEDPAKFIAEEAAKLDIDMIVMGKHGRTGLEKVFMGSVTSKVIGYAPCNILIVPRESRVGFRKVLLATDGSKYSAAAAEKAITISKQYGSFLSVLSIVPTEFLYNVSADTGYTQKQLEHMGKEAFELTEKNVKAVRESAEKEGIRAEGIILGGRPYETIIEQTESRNIDLVIVGSHGRTGLKKLIMGSVAERVVALSPCAVLVVKTTEK
jgi:nucleotide-binding universal stress UspA family protein